MKCFMCVANESGQMPKITQQNDLNFVIFVKNCKILLVTDYGLFL